jgi:hypothetical protein
MQDALIQYEKLLPLFKHASLLYTFNTQMNTWTPYHIFHPDHRHFPGTSEPCHYHLSPCNALRYSGVSFRYYGH